MRDCSPRYSLTLGSPANVVGLGRRRLRRCGTTWMAIFVLVSVGCSGSGDAGGSGNEDDAGSGGAPGSGGAISSGGASTGGGSASGGSTAGGTGGTTSGTGGAQTTT